MNKYRLPDWLQPYKNEWRTVGRLQQIVRSEGLPFAVLFQQIKGRARVVEEPAKNGMGMTRRYLVKQVWALARAHGVELLPTLEAAPQQRLLQEIGLLREQLLHAKQATRVVHVDRPVPDATLVRLALQATEPRPVAGVYFLLDEAGGVVYVGQSGNVLARMAGHTEKRFATARMLAEPNDLARLRLEATLIAALQPPINVKGKGRRTA